MTIETKLLAALAAIALPLTAAGAQNAEPQARPAQAQAQGQGPAQAQGQGPAQAQPQAQPQGDAEAEPQGNSGQQDTQPAAEAAEPSPVVAATPADIRAGARVVHTSGEPVGTIESVDEDGAVVSTGGTRAKLPFGSFGKNNRGLVIALTKTQLEAAASEATGS